MLSIGVEFVWLQAIQLYTATPVDEPQRNIITGEEGKSSRSRTRGYPTDSQTVSDFLLNWMFLWLFLSSFLSHKLSGFLSLWHIQLLHSSEDHLRVQTCMLSFRKRRQNLIRTRIQLIILQAIQFPSSSEYSTGPVLVQLQVVHRVWNRVPKFYLDFVWNIHEILVNFLPTLKNKLHPQDIFVEQRTKRFLISCKLLFALFAKRGNFSLKGLYLHFANC